MIKRQEMRIGWGSRDVTPAGKVSLCGQFHTRISDVVNDPFQVYEKEQAGLENICRLY